MKILFGNKVFDLNFAGIVIVVHRFVCFCIYRGITLYMYFESTAIDIGNVFSSFN